MIWTVFKISVLRLWNNKLELVLTFAVPVMFFSIFALIFSRGVSDAISQVRVSFVDDDRTRESRELIHAACQHENISPATGVGRTTTDWSIERLSRSLISQRAVEVVVHIPAGFTTQDPDSPHLSIRLFNQGINPLAHRMVQASLAESIAMQFAEVNLLAATQLRPKISLASSIQTIPEVPTAEVSGRKSTHPSRTANDQQVFEAVNAFAGNKNQPKIAMYAAGIAVMFLLFSASGTGASLLEEREAGTLGRLLSSRLSVTQLLLGKWFYMTTLGTAQLLVMFLWGQLVFQVDLLGHLPGFFALTATTTSACASFALLLATICRSRQQLHGVSVVLILSMSAVGGSMVPRYIMSDSMKRLGKFTFNGWALDGFQKVFWYDLPLTAIRDELVVLLSMTIVMGLTSCLLAQRWSKI